MPDDLGERTEQATPRRLRQARADGHVARSHDLGAAVALLLADVGNLVRSRHHVQGGTRTS